jgi:F0F1-type ATP synthase, alpha subunit
VAGTLKLAQAEYRELEAFSKFGSDLDAATKAVLDRGARNVEILKQGQFSPVPVEEQIAILFCGTKGLMVDIPLEKIKDFEDNFIAHLRREHKDILDVLRHGEITDEIMKKLEGVANKMSVTYKV